MRGILDQFDYDGWLGHRWYQDRSEFKLWAPTAANVQVALYRDLNQTPGGGHYEAAGGMRILPSFVTEPYALFEMTRSEQGVWSATVLGNWADENTQWWYMFRVTHPQGHVAFAIDPHVTAVSANEGLGAIINDEQRGAPLRGEDNLTWLQRGYRYINGEREYVERPAPEMRINPLTGNPYQIDHIIYELHVRDFSIHPSSGINPAYRGTFSAFTHRGTVARVHVASGACTAVEPFDISLCANENCWVIPQDDDGNNIYVSTGLDHLIELGVTTVHLLPFYDQRHVNELQPNRQIYNTRHAMNWGYDPQNYNVPEGTYSTDTTIPYLRIRELKAAINAMHSVGIRVVKDVVYNHTASVTDGPFQASVPYYFHRTWCTGMIAGAGSGVGNELACERPMVRRYIIDSLLYWQREFGIDGFRFDLMWLHDIHTMKAAVEALRAVDPTVIIYGEPWAASPAGSPLNYPFLFEDSEGNLREVFENRPLPSSAQNITGNGFGFFNDTTRNTLRGGNRDSNSGFMNGSIGGAVVNDVWRGIRAATPHVARASESVNYVSKHDDMVMFDNVAWSLGAERGGIDATGASNWSMAQFFSQYRTINNDAFRRDPHHTINRDDIMDNNLVRSVVFGTGIVLTSQGIPFIHAADSFLRSKRGHENTFNSDDFFNAIRWDQKVEFIEVHKYFMGLIELRNSRPAFRMDTRESINATYHAILPNPPASVPPVGSDLLLAYRLGEHASGDPWRNIFVAYNGANEPRVVNFVWHEPLHVVVDDRDAGTEVLWTIQPREAFSIPPFSMVVAFDVYIPLCNANEIYY
jgi:pullulanase